MYTDKYREFSENCQILIRSLSNNSNDSTKFEEIQGSLIKNENNVTIQMVLDRYSQKVRSRRGATGNTA